MQFAHVKWFNDTSANVASLSATEIMAAILLIIAGLSVLYVINSFTLRRGIVSALDAKFSPFRQWVPLIVRLSTAAFLIINTLQGHLLAPNVPTQGNGISVAICALYLVTAIYFILGVYTKFASILLITGYLVTITQSDVVSVLEHVEYLGIAGYMWFRGPGAYSLSAWMSPKKQLIVPNGRKYALTVYRIGIGLGLAVLGLSEKLYNIGLSQEFLYTHNWNLLAFAGISDRWFIIIAGSIEVLIGIALIVNLAPRLLMLAVAGLMITTASLLGIQEVYGHLFAIGIFVAIWVNDAKPAAYDVLGAVTKHNKRSSKQSVPK
jgi:uncharacterized membrane protein YphA (DoxX/SURF4 family)